MAIKSEEPREKKPRIRHSEPQLAALNALYEENEHPTLEERAALATSLNMEPKAVNAWFANKRSATKKKSRGLNTGSSTPPPPSQLDELDDDDDESVSPLPRSRLSTPYGVLEREFARQIHKQLTFSAMDSDNRSVFDSDSQPGRSTKSRIRPTPKQLEELRRLYNANTHPSREEREALGDKIGMKYQSVTNWFQNQRSQARRKADGESSDINQPANTNESFDDSISHARYANQQRRAFSPYPQATLHPSLTMPTNPAIPRVLVDNREPEHEKYNTVHRLGGVPLSRPRRTRPEPHQLDALKKLFARTSNPSIEERGALALEIGMELGKVTNWFRNLRQTARKRAQKPNADDGEDDSMDFDSVPVSRDVTPIFHSNGSSCSSSADGDEMERMALDGDAYAHHIPGSEGCSDEDDQEAITPPPAVAGSTGRRRMDVGFLTGSPSDEIPKPTLPPDCRASVEDALLLLTFSRQSPQ